MDRFNITIIVILILIILGEGIYGGYKTSQVGVECDIGVMDGKICWYWKTELKQEIVAGELDPEEFYEKQKQVIKDTEGIVVEENTKKENSGCGYG